MEKNKYLKQKVIILIIILVVLIVKLISVRNQYFVSKYEERFGVKAEKSIIIEEKYGYSEILEVLRNDKALQLKSINMKENEKCNIELNYTGDIKLVYNSLYSLTESRNFLAINSISINRNTETTNINIDFKKNK